jgi:hypothetical protein
VGFGMNAPSVILQLNSQGVSPMAFSHCLTSSDDGGSILVLGEAVMPGFVFTPLVPSRSVFFPDVTSINEFSSSEFCVVYFNLFHYCIFVP